MKKWLAEKIRQNRVLCFNVNNRDRWIIEQAALLTPGGMVLDVGAGSCPYRKYFNHCHYKTQDFVALLPDQLRHGDYGHIDYVSDAVSIPVPDGSFDTVLCTEVLEHVLEPIKVVQECFRVLRPGGKLILTAPLGSGTHQEPYHYYGGYTKYWYNHFLAKIGFENIIINANAGSFMFYSQESIRFVRTTRPFRLKLPLMVQLVWIPLWVGLALLLCTLVPIICSYLDKFDAQKRFTVGYHVLADVPRP